MDASTITKDTIPPTLLRRSAWPELRLALAVRGMSLADLARQSGIRYARLTKANCGIHRPSEHLIALVADSLGVDPETIRPRGVR